MIRMYPNIIHKNLQEHIKNTLLEKQFPWFFVKDISQEGNPNQKRPGFSHHYFAENEINSDYFEIIEPIISNTFNKSKTTMNNYDRKDIIEARSFLQLPLNKDYIGEGVDTPHIDKRFPHMVFLYYVLDSDGDTIIYENKFNKDNKESQPPKDLKLLVRFKPKQGTVVIFDGAHYHTAEQPRHNTRCIININIDKKSLLG